LTFHLKDAAKLAAGVKAALPDDQPVTIEASLTLKSDDGDYLVLKVTGSPPFLKYDVAVEDTVRTYLGHPDMI
jgi:hypothetical protein